MLIEVLFLPTTYHQMPTFQLLGCSLHRGRHENYSLPCELSPEHCSFFSGISILRHAIQYTCAVSNLACSFRSYAEFPGHRARLSRPVSRCDYTTDNKLQLPSLIPVLQAGLRLGNEASSNPLIYQSTNSKQP